MRELERLLKDYNLYIYHQAHKRKRHDGELEDLAQAARIALWRAYEEEGVDGKPHPSSYYKQRIRWAISDEGKRLAREPLHESLDAEEVDS